MWLTLNGARSHISRANCTGVLCIFWSISGLDLAKNSDWNRTWNGEQGHTTPAVSRSLLQCEPSLNLNLFLHAIILLTLDPTLELCRILFSINTAIPFDYTLVLVLDRTVSGDYIYHCRKLFYNNFITNFINPESKMITHKKTDPNLIIGL